MNKLLILATLGLIPFSTALAEEKALVISHADDALQ